MAVEILHGDGSPTRPDDLRTGGEPTPVMPTDLDELDPDPLATLTSTRSAIATSAAGRPRGPLRA